MGAITFMVGLIFLFVSFYFVVHPQGQEGFAADFFIGWLTGFLYSVFYSALLPFNPSTTIARWVSGEGACAAVLRIGIVYGI